MKLKTLLFGEKAFRCGGERCLEFSGQGTVARIWYRQPTSDEIMEYCHTVLKSSQSELRKLESEDIDMQKMHEMTRKNKLLPYARKIFIRAEGYKDEHGKDCADFDTIAKWYGHHIEQLAIYGYAQEDSCKKKG